MPQESTISAGLSASMTIQRALAMAFIYRNGTYSSFDVPEALDTEPGGINDLGQIVGAYEGTDSRTHGFLKRQEGFTAIDYPGAAATVPYGINSAGQIVGLFDEEGSGNYQG